MATVRLIIDPLTSKQHFEVTSEKVDVIPVEDARQLYFGHLRDAEFHMAEAARYKAMLDDNKIPLTEKEIVDGGTEKPA